MRKKSNKDVLFHKLAFALFIHALDFPSLLECNAQPNVPFNKRRRRGSVVGKLNCFLVRRLFIIMGLEILGHETERGGGGCPQFGFRQRKYEVKFPRNKLETLRN